MNYNPISEDPTTVDLKFPPTMLPAFFTSHGSKLLGTMLLANGEGPHPIIILLHGFPGNENNFDLAHVFRRMGFNVMIFHYRGSWGSEGKFSFSNCLQDVGSVIDFLRLDETAEKFRVDPKRIVLIGHSQGGFNALMTTAGMNDITNCVSIAGFNFGYFGKLLKQFPAAREITLEGLKNGSAIINSAEREILYEEIISHSDDWDLIDRVKSLSSKNVLMIGARRDFVAAIDIHHNPLVNSMIERKPTFFEHHILNCGHSFSDKRIELAKILVDWLKRIKNF